MAAEQPDSRPIRRGTEKDLDRILEIERRSFERQWDADEFKAALNELFLVYQEVEVSGFLSACCCAFARRAIIMSRSSSEEPSSFTRSSVFGSGRSSRRMTMRTRASAR